MSNVIHFALPLLLSLLLAPMLMGVINRVKAIAAGRHGKPILQTYYDIWRLLQKSEVTSNCAGWPFAICPAIVLGTTIAALLLFPLGGKSAPLAFYGDFLLAAYLLGMGRFALMLGALDTGSSFEGMGASREAAFGALAEPALFLAFLILTSICLDIGNFSATSTISAFSLSGMMSGQAAQAWSLGRPELLLTPIIFFILLLAENCRIPVDDPTTHLELTMIHEVMVLDYSGPNLALITYAASLKLWLFAALIAALLTPPTTPLAACLIWLAIIFAVGTCVGLVESTLARLRLLRIPQLLGMASALAALGVILAQVN